MSYVATVDLLWWKDLQKLSRTCGFQEVFANERKASWVCYQILFFKRGSFFSSSTLFFICPMWTTLDFMNMVFLWQERSFKYPPFPLFCHKLWENFSLLRFLWRDYFSCVWLATCCSNHSFPNVMCSTAWISLIYIRLLSCFQLE